MQRIGVWGSEYFGRGHFGWAQAGAIASFSLLSESLKGLLTQTTPNAQIISTEVTIGGVDTSELVGRIDAVFSEENRTATAAITLIGEMPSWVVAGATVDIYQTFILETGLRLTSRLFSGLVKTLTPYVGGLSKTVQVQCWDYAESRLASAPYNTTWTGAARALVIDELTRCGCSECDVNFQDYSISGALPGYSTVRDLVRAVSCQADEARILSLPSGRVMVWSYLASSTTSLLIPETGYTSIQSPSSQHDKYRTYTVTGTGGVSSSASGTGDTDDGETLVLLASGAARAAAVIGKSERARRVIQLPINPFIRIGNVIQVASGVGTESIRVTAITHSVEWSGESSPGCWSSVSGEVVL